METVIYLTDPEAPHLGGNIHGGDINSYTPNMWDWMIEEFRPKTILDVGCGQGQSCSYFSNKGCFVIGIDGLKMNVDACTTPCILHDITHGPLIINNIDLCWCCEVVEHISEEHIDSLMRTITNGRVVAVTHAIPGQCGHHHVNCQPESYWVDIFSKYNYSLLREKTDHGRQICRENASPNSHFGRSGLIFSRN